MNRALWIVKKNETCCLIKKISDYYGGDDIEWLQEYTKDLIKINQADIQKALDCFWDLEGQLNYMPRRAANNVIRETSGTGKAV